MNFDEYEKMWDDIDEFDKLDGFMNVLSNKNTNNLEDDILTVQSCIDKLNFAINQGYVNPEDKLVVGGFGKDGHTGLLRNVALLKVIPILDEINKNNYVLCIIDKDINCEPNR
jgi:hypothetical protein